MSKLYGLLGGLGPRASAVFLNSLYAFSKDIQNEQELPRVVMLSDPTVLDRTYALLNQRENLLFQDLCDRLDTLQKINTDKVAILCFTTHYFSHILQKRYDNFISLTDLALKEIIQKKEKILILCSKGTNKLQIFQKSVYWPFAEPYVHFPSEYDQHTVHDILYDIKKNHKPESIHPRLNEVVQNYPVQYALAGCTELHIVARQELTAHQINFNLVDPLQSLIEIIHQN